MASISGQLEQLYMSTSRKDMNDTLTDVLLAACVTPALMPDRLLMEHVLLVSVLHHTVGLEVNTHLVLNSACCVGCVCLVVFPKIETTHLRIDISSWIIHPRLFFEGISCTIMLF